MQRFFDEKPYSTWLSIVGDCFGSRVPHERSGRPPPAPSNRAERGGRGVIDGGNSLI
jgi:hypothetical protein